MIPDKQVTEPAFSQLRKFIHYTIAALPCFLLGLAYCWPFSRFPKAFGLSYGDLAHMVQMEFLVIHSFPFLAIVGLMQPVTPTVRWWRRIMVGFLIILYIGLAKSMYGWLGIFLFAGLTITTYLGFFLHLTKPRVVNQLVIRWAVNCIIYFSLVMVFEMPTQMGNWPGAKNIYPLGAHYFIISALVECTGFYHANWINRLPISDIFAKLQELLKQKKV